MMKTQKRIISCTGIVFHIKNLVSMVLVFVIFITLNSCSFQNERKMQEVIIEYEIPFIDTDSRWNDVSLVETDEYGRKLYSVAATGDAFNNVFSDYIEDDAANSPVFAYFICQKYNGSNVYCYKDVCYIFVSNLNVSDEVLNNLKNENDWNKDLNQSKMTSLSMNLGNEVEYSLEFKEKAIAALEKELNREFQGYYIDDLYTNTNKLCFILREVEVWINDNGGQTNDFGKSYIFTYDDTSDKVCYEELSDDIESWRSQISQFKVSAE